MKARSFHIVLLLCLFLRQSETLILTRKGNRPDNRRELIKRTTVLKVVVIILFLAFIFWALPHIASSFASIMYRKLRVTPINTRRKRILFAKFNQQMRYLRNKRIRGLHSLRDIETKRMRDKTYQALNQLMHRTKGKGVDRKKFNREYPTLSRFVIRKAKENRKLTLTKLFSISNEYAKRYHHIDLMKNKTIMGLAMGKFLSEIPRIVKQLSS